ncbi:MAG: sulfide-dependent adenosine diphosphate thiazole synthase [Candidatus Cloacimonetes bacterium]|jgi:thiamine thiazole synthase|nr:sulfide-dependent adenosine diphosphate thiazole synthase [Candidatus Cloacimonadota bacterium]MDD4157022.1 sulfide-dependent adenosine diphosphate thiazole synthase [Candidatus Cloacimonadota bacterium]
MESIISKAIVKNFFEKLENCLELDVAIVGGGPSGLVCSTELAKKGYKVALFEEDLAPGGGMWGGAMMFNEIVVQKEAIQILDEFKISYQKFDDNYYTADSVEATSSLIYHSKKAGVKIFNCISIEDVVFLNNKVSGIVINWGPVSKSKMHIDPLIITAKAVLDATGHPSEIAKITASKNDIQLLTETGNISGEKSLSMEKGEQETVKNTSMIYPGLYVSGMAANGVHGGFRMGPIFGGMLLSGKKSADLIHQALKDA